MNTELKTIAEIKTAVEAGHDVRCMGGAYHVIKDSIGQWLIHCELNDHYIGLHGRDGTKYENELNGSDFYIAGAPEPKSKAVRFSFPDGTEFSGFAFGDTWNGWDVIHVDADTLQQIDDWIASYSVAGCNDCMATASLDDIGTTCRQCGRGVIETDSGLESLREIEPDTDGLYDLNGFCTSIESD